MKKQILLILFLITGYSALMASGITVTTPVYDNQVLSDPTSITFGPGFEVADGVTFEAQIGVSSGSPISAPSTVNAAVNQNVSLPSTQNYIHTWAPREKMTSIVSGYDIKEMAEDIQYFDGLGRPSQAISVASSPDMKDIVQLFEYDELGREARKYLPYEASANNNGQFISVTTDVQREAAVKGFYNGYVSDANDKNYPWAETVFEASPLNRVVEQGAPGAAWQPQDGSISNSGHVIETEYLTNTSVSSWVFRNNNYDSISYEASKLFVIKTTDEQDNINYEYKDFEGKVIMKKSMLGTQEVVTKYVYDDYGQLACVVPPLANDKGVTPITAGEELCYHYRYSGRHLMTQKKLPGADWVYMVYDARDRLVLTQDSRMRDENDKQWLYTLYDNLNRPTQTGVVTFSTAYTRNNLETSLRANIDYLDEGSGISLSARTKTTYDNYVVSTTSGAYKFTAVSANDFSLSHAKASKNKGRITESETWVEDPGGSNSKWLKTVNYYDKFGKLIQVISDNFLNGKDIISTNYDFRGIAQSEYYQHTSYPDESNPTQLASFTLHTKFDYDHRDRLLTTQCKLNSENWVTMSSNEYDQLGQLKAKYLHDEGTAGFLQKTDYAYNIRGWLTSINSPDLTTQENDVFGMELNYDKLNHIKADNQYNGNISGVTWKNRGAASKSQYFYTYDSLNRITKADYELVGTSNTYKYDVPTIEYDHNGNITKLQRRSDYNSSSTAYLLDNLDYEYKNGGASNQLDYVTDAAQDRVGFPDFPSYAITNTAYDYDGNGNLTQDDIKGITEIAYNYLNLPISIKGEGVNTGGVYNLYSASGQKLRKQLFTTTNFTSEIISERMDYAGKAVYKGKKLQYILMGEGRIAYNNETGTYTWQYDIKDHLGNTRAVVAQLAEGQPTVMQQSSYYPFGLEMQGMGAGLTREEQPYLYNGKESVNDLDLGWYDYGARFYDPALGRWHVIDPLAEKYKSYGPYVYTINNPIKFIDPDGKRIKFADNQSKSFKRSTRRTLIRGSIQSRTFRKDVIKAVFHKNTITIKEQTSNNLRFSGNETRVSSVDIMNWEDNKPMPPLNPTSQEIDETLTALDKHEANKPTSHQDGTGTDVEMTLHTPEMDKASDSYSTEVQVSHELDHALRLLDGTSETNRETEEKMAIKKQNNVAKEQNKFRDFWQKDGKRNKIRSENYYE